MTRFIKLPALALVTLLAVATLGLAEGSDEQASGERIEVSLGSINVGAAFPEGVDDPMRDWIEERFNMTLVPKDYNWGDMETKINTWAASATLPDVFFMAHIGTGRYFQWIEDGVVRALPEDLSPWPHVEWTVDNTGVREYDVDGRTYVLPRGGAKVLPSSHPELATSNLWWGSRTLFVRKDWMEKLGIDDPADRRGVHRDVRALRHRRSGRQRRGRHHGLHPAVDLALLQPDLRLRLYRR